MSDMSGQGDAAGQAGGGPGQGQGGWSVPGDPQPGYGPLPQFGQAYPQQPVPQQQFPQQPWPQQPYGGQPFYGQQPGQPPIQDQPPYDRPPYGQPPYGQSQPQWGAAPGRVKGGGASSRRTAILASVAGVVVLAVIAAAVLVLGHSGGGSAVADSGTVSPSALAASASTAAGVPAASSTSAAGGALSTCSPAQSISDERVGYQPCGTAARDVGVPTFDSVAAHKKYTVTIKTSRGTIVFTANGDAAPYTVYSFVYLVQKAYFDNTPCHRLTTASIYVLQCGDPSGSGSGGPGYQFQDEDLASLGSTGSDGAVTYHAGVVAMANDGPGTDGSQFFLVYKDSPIPPQYTPFGTITQGMSVLTQTAAAGADDSFGAGDGAPKESVQVESVTVAAL